MSSGPAGCSISESRDRRGIDVHIRSGPQMREYHHIADRVAAQRPSPVLDWGCGFGQLTWLMRERGLAVESYDFKAEQPLREVELPSHPELSMQVSGEPVALPYEDGHFGAVLSCGVLEHVQDPDGSLDEIHRILRPGGRLFVFKLPNRRSYLEAIARVLGLYYHGSLPHDKLYDRGRAERLLAGHRFRVDEVRLANMLPLSISRDVAWRYAGQIWTTNRALSRIPLLNLLATNVEAIATAV